MVTGAAIGSRVADCSPTSRYAADADRARRGARGALHPQSTYGGLNSYPRLGSPPVGLVHGADGRVLRNGTPRTESGPEGSSSQRNVPCAAGTPDLSRVGSPSGGAPKSTAGARSAPSSAVLGYGLLAGLLGAGRPHPVRLVRSVGGLPVALPEVPAPEVLRARRASACGERASLRGSRPASGACVSLLGSAWNGKDDDGTDPREGVELHRVGPRW